MSSATAQLVATYADLKTRPPAAVGGTIDWQEFLEPFSFKEVFPRASTSEIIAYTDPISNTSNYWLTRAHHILQCTRQINQLIRVFETFFQTLGYEGLRDIDRVVNLNSKIDFDYNPILDKQQAIYFTALYDFLLREHAINIARPILHLLHTSFPESAQLNLLHSHLIDAVEPPIYSYMLYDEEDYEDLHNISSSSA
jgi:hypothetical protein